MKISLIAASLILSSSVIASPKLPSVTLTQELQSVEKIQIDIPKQELIDIITLQNEISRQSDLSSLAVLPALEWTSLEIDAARSIVS